MDKPTLFNDAGRQWHRWFAWHPVFALDEDADVKTIKMVWGRWVWRKSDEFWDYPGPSWDYRVGGGMEE